MADPYLTKPEAVARLTHADDGYGLTSDEAGMITGGDLRVASDELDSMGPFVGAPASDGQEREFPRDEASEVPADVLDACALIAYHLAADESPAVTRSSVLDQSVSFATPKQNRYARRIASLIRPYQLWVGSQA